MNINKESKRFCIVGCGRLGTALAVYLPNSDFSLASLASLSLESAGNAAGFAGAGRVCQSPEEAADKADLIFITTPDTVIEPVCRNMAGKGVFRQGQTVFHLSGALSSDILEPARDAGAQIGSIHPLQAFTPYESGQASPFKGINVSVEGDAGAVELGRAIIRALGARAFAIPTRAKTLYHASAVVASNYLVTLEHFALRLLAEADLPEDQAYAILEPLIMGTLKNIKAKGSVKALTGPVARGDDEIVRRHLAGIDRDLPGFSNLYRILGQYTVEIADQGGTLTPEAGQALAGLFKL